MNELLPKERAFKLVLQYENNSDQDLFGFYPSVQAAQDAAPALEKKCASWVGNRKLIVKYTDPEMICNRVGTDYEHFNRALIPNEEFNDSFAASCVLTPEMTKIRMSMGYKDCIKLIEHDKGWFK